MVRAELGIRESSSHVIAGLRGELDIEDATRIAVDLAALAATGKCLIVDLAALRFVDCAGLGGLLQARKLARQAGGDVLLAAPRQQALRVLTATGLNHVFSVHASVTAAHAAASAGSHLHPASDRADPPARNGFPAATRIVKGQR